MRYRKGLAKSGWWYVQRHTEYMNGWVTLAARLTEDSADALIEDLISIDEESDDDK